MCDANRPGRSASCETSYAGRGDTAANPSEDCWMETHASTVASFPRRNEEGDGALARPTRGPGPSPDSEPAPRALAVCALYHLSETGRKISLLEGGDGRAIQ